MIETIALIATGVLMAGIFGWLTYRGFKTGRMWERNNDFSRRSSEPVFFWIFAVLNMAMGGLGLWVIEIGVSGLPK